MIKLESVNNSQIYQSTMLADVHPVQGLPLHSGSAPFGKHERVLLAFSVLFMTLLFPSPAHVVQGVLLGMLLLASRLPAGDPGQVFRVDSCQECDLFVQVERCMQ